MRCCGLEGNYQICSATERDSLDLMLWYSCCRRADAKMTNFNGGSKLVNRLTMHDLKTVQDSFSVIICFHFFFFIGAYY